VKRVELASGVFHLQSGSNVGLVVRDGKGLLIDTGLDKDAARRALRAADELGVALEAVFITHAHADHFGGAYLLQRRAEMPLYAPALEAAMMENPIVEPLYLFSGAAPIGELRHKFTLAQPCRVDHIVEGPGALRVRAGEGMLRIRYDAEALSAQVEAMDLDDARLRGSWGGRVYRVVLRARAATAGARWVTRVEAV